MAMLLRVSLLMFMLGSMTGAGLAADIQGQKPVMFVGDTFQFVPGAWASYYIHDKGKNEHYVMHMATLERVKQDGKQCSWMEIEMLPESGPSVVTRILTEETKQGPGDLLDVIVQVKGYSPFTVPKKYYEGENKEVGEFRTTQITKRIVRRTFDLSGRNITAWEVEAADDKGNISEAMVSEQVLPIGVIMAETPQAGMYLKDWGTNAKSKIDGTPMNFYLWLMMQIGAGLTE